ncbi:MAG: tetratricopeptide repeat protein, partial [Pseudomonadota bacterium]
MTTLAAFAASFVAMTAVSPVASARTPDTTGPMRSLAGSYLAGRFARSKHDTERAARFYRNALFRDRESPVLVEQSFLMEASEGHWAEAELLAKRLVKIQDNHRMARMFLGLSAFKKQKYLEAEKHFQKADSGPIGELT